MPRTESLWRFAKYWIFANSECFSISGLKLKKIVLLFSILFELFLKRKMFLLNRHDQKGCTFSFFLLTFLLPVHQITNEVLKFQTAMRKKRLKSFLLPDILTYKNIIIWFAIKRLSSLYSKNMIPTFTLRKFITKTSTEHCPLRLWQKVSWVVGKNEQC